MNRFEFKNGYSINPVINGCWQLSQGHYLTNPLDFDDVMKGFYMLYEQGFTTFDCADIYTGVEEFIGKFVKEVKGSTQYSSDKIQVHTKYVPDLNQLDNVDFKFTEQIIDRSLKRLNKETLELVQFHWWEYETSGCIEVANHLVKLQEKGKIQNIGVTNFDTKHLKELVDAGIPVVSMQAQYSLFDRRPEKELQKYCVENNIPMLCYGTLSGGFLSERWIGKNIDVVETRSQIKYLQIIEDTLGWEGFQKLLLLLKKIGDKYEVSISNVATKYILSQPGVGATIVGIRNSNHVKSNGQIFKFTLDDKEISEIKVFLQKYPNIEGEPFQLERTVGSKYRNIMKMNLNEDEQS